MADNYFIKYRPLYKAFKACVKEYGTEEAKKIISWILDRLIKDADIEDFKDFKAAKGV